MQKIVALLFSTALLVLANSKKTYAQQSAVNEATKVGSYRVLGASYARANINGIQYNGVGQMVQINLYHNKFVFDVENIIFFK
jgi:hypothetical protein